LIACDLFDPPRTPLTARLTRNCPSVPAAITAAPFTAGETCGRHSMSDDSRRTTGSFDPCAAAPQRRQKLSSASIPAPHAAQYVSFIARRSYQRT
jgi:hypothetical protein